MAMRSGDIEPSRNMQLHGCLSWKSAFCKDSALVRRQDRIKSWMCMTPLLPMDADPTYARAGWQGQAKLRRGYCIQIQA